MRNRNMRRHSVGGDVVKGAIAGAVATFVMGKVTTYMYDRQSEKVRQEEDAARGGGSAYEIAAEKAASAAGTALDRPSREKAGSGIHWALGMGAGAVYAVLRRRFEPLGSAAGTAFGTAFWAFLDEGAVPALGLTPGPTAFPWQTHARGLVGHLTFGTVTDGTLRLLDRVA